MTTKAESAAAGLRKILLATAVAGALGYVIQLAAPALVDNDANYVTFSVYWSTLYLFVAALSGVQQEITRAAHPAAGTPGSPVLRQFTLIAATVSVIVVAVLAMLFGASILPGPTGVLAGSLSVGVVGYLLVAVLSGVLYGLRLWTAVAAITVLDVAIRALLVIGGLYAGWSPEWIAVAVSVPFGAAFVIVWLAVRRRVVGAFRLDVGLGSLLAHVGGTVAAAAAMGLMMNGLPMLLGISTGAADTSALAGVILAITLTRAPIVVPLLALQSYLISLLRGGGSLVRRRILIALAIGVVVGAILSLVAAIIGPWAISTVSAGRSEVDATMMAAIAAGAALVAMMCVTGPALLAARRHTEYVLGWVVSAALTVVCLFTPISLEPRLVLTLLLPPCVGVVVHVIAVWRHRDPGEPPVASPEHD